MKATLVDGIHHLLCEGDGDTPQEVMNNCGEPIRIYAVKDGERTRPRVHCRASRLADCIALMITIW